MARSKLGPKQLICRIKEALNAASILDPLFVVITTGFIVFNFNSQICPVQQQYFGLFELHT